MFTPIDRYDEFNAATINARLTQLETRLLALRDPNEVIVEGTLTAATETINIDPTTTEWAMLHLTAALLISGQGQVLRFNNDAAGNYSWARIDARTAGWGVSWGTASPNPTMIPLPLSGAGEVTTVCNIDLYITPTPTGFYQTMVLGEGLALSTNNTVFQMGGSYRYTPTLIQLTFNTTGSGYLYSVGSTYRLEGIRA